MAVDQQIWYWPYEVHSANALNSVSKRKTFHGFLIRVNDGFACIHPWPELGDAPVDQQLNSLKNSSPTNLGKRALYCAELDVQARYQNISLYKKSEPLPMNHWLWLSGDSVKQISGNGFQTVKLKVGPANLPTDLLNEFQQAGIKVRLDANDSLDFDTMTTWWQSLPSDTQAAIEFIEDPIPWNAKRWSQLKGVGMPIAADRDVCQRLAEADWAIVKPATDGSTSFGTDKVVFTSYMDHPLGQVWAASQAQKYYTDHPAQTCGLLTHRCFEENEFTEQLLVDGTALLPPEGTGLGFDDLLEKLPWQRLI